MSTHSNFIILIGETITEILGALAGSDEITIKTASGRTFRLYHEQDCCESVDVRTVTGDLTHIIGSVVTAATETINRDTVGYSDSATETTFVLTTEKGSLTIFWVGESNGYYGEEVSFVEDKA
jgi:hypothetical protein